MAMRIKELQPEASTRAIAGIVGADQSTVVRDLANANAAAEAGKPMQNQEEVDANASPVTGADAAHLVDNPCHYCGKRDGVYLIRNPFNGCSEPLHESCAAFWFDWLGKIAGRSQV